MNEFPVLTRHSQILRDGCVKRSAFKDKNPSTAECQFCDFEDKQPKLSINQGKSYFQWMLLKRGAGKGSLGTSCQRKPP